MLRSMTGYGRGEQLGDDRSIVVEARSVNHRFLDVSVRITRAFCSLENEIKKMASAYVSRGKVDVSIQYEPGSSAAPSLSVNAAAAGHVHALLEQVKRDLGVTGDIGMDTLLAFREMIFEQKGEDVTVEQYRQWLQPVLEQAFAALKEMQAAEGAEIGKDILARLGVIGTTLEQIEAVFPAAL
ncbi:MAG: hypothetical protein GY868_18230, partial [Deltaproteobacteria bacterium]|nr:hypothetical protein [Deltaproteobacteria bacterium]